ncbi:MAG TPA: zf-HC2 domain-containing protein [Acidimicrobiales bacterium]|nr:zf-HC2 domain-containing protein [Acidimicrobiales bacterium]
MTRDRCDQWHGLVAMEFVGQLADEDRLALSAHLDGCQDCRDERGDLAGLARILPAADPSHLGGHEVPFALQGAVFGRLADDARHEKRGRRVRYGLVAAAAASVAAVALVFGLSGSPGGSGPGQSTVALHGSNGVQASAQLTTKPWGTAVHIEESGQRGGQDLSVSMRTSNGSWWAAGTYRTVTGRTVRVDLACAVPASKITEIWVRNRAGQTVLRGYLA